MRHEVWLNSLVVVAALAVGCAGGAEKVRPGPMPQGGTFTGVWFSPQYGEMHLLETGATVVGRYEKGERKGRIQGHVTGDLMRFQWSEKRELVIGHASETLGHGYFRIVYDQAEDNYKLLGEWGHDDAETGGGAWNAVKSKRRRPDVGGSGGGGASSSSFDDGSGSGSDFEQNDSNWEEDDQGYDEDLGDL